ncbi:MAG TPA: type VI secretion system baseplate subunit TssE [Thermoanaerobaculia bacterium]
MAERTNQVYKPLFDRLVDRMRFPRYDLTPVRTIDREGLKESVRRELEQLFNTRCPVPEHLLAGRLRTVIDYGIPDFSMVSARNFADRTRLAAIVRNAVEIYEPRLANVRVEIEAIAGNDFRLNGLIAGELVVDGVPTPVLFTTLFDLKERQAEVQ